MVDKGTAVVIDTRDAASYKANHIKGSINIPLNDVASRIGELPRDKMIAAYCS
jgi:rhodanese-related sulfurtransferase